MNNPLIIGDNESKLESFIKLAIPGGVAVNFIHTAKDPNHQMSTWPKCNLYAVCASVEGVKISLYGTLHYLNILMEQYQSIQV